MFFKLRGQNLGQLPDTRLISRVTDIKDLAIRATILILNYPAETVDPIPDIGKTSLLLPPVNQLNRSAGNQVKDELSDCPRAADPS
jgi:hypothetical protein